MNGRNGIIRAKRAFVRALAADGTIRMTWAPEVMESPAPFAGHPIDPDRVRGMLLGLAIGDALGNTSEGLLPGVRSKRYGEIRNYLPNRDADDEPVGLPSDDTQLAFWTLEHVLTHGGIEPDALAERLCSAPISGCGHTMRAFVRSWCQSRDWKKASQSSAGNGALMRIAAVLAPHLTSGSAELWSDAVLGTAITHNDRAAIASSVSFVGLLAELLKMNGAPPAEWWVDAFVRRARPIEGEDTKYEPRGGSLFEKWSGPLWRFIAEQVPPRIGSPTAEAGDIWFSGAYLLETVPTVLHILARHGADPEQAIMRAVNDTKDNDTVAAIVGAAVGALHGETALPQRWRNGLGGRVIANVDDRRVWRLLDEITLRLS